LGFSSLGVGAFSITNTNKQIYLGYATITGNGTTSILEAVAENNLIVGIEDKTSYVDFYINYNMKCNGDTDTGLILLAVAINGQNITLTPPSATTFNSQNGTLKIENITVNRTDSFSFIIQVIYTSFIPLYANQTQALGAGVLSKSAKYISDSYDSSAEKSAILNADTQSIGYSLYVWTFPSNCKICVKQNNQLIEQSHTDDKQIFPFAGFCYWEERFNGTIQVCVEQEGLPVYVKNIQMNNDVGFMVFRNLFSIPIPRIFWPS
jgi:hypothetical protein